MNKLKRRQGTGKLLYRVSNSEVYDSGEEDNSWTSIVMRGGEYRRRTILNIHEDVRIYENLIKVSGEAINEDKKKIFDFGIISSACWEPPFATTLDAALSSAGVLAYVRRYLINDYWTSLQLGVRKDKYEKHERYKFPMVDPEEGDSIDAVVNVYFSRYFTGKSRLQETVELNIVYKKGHEFCYVVFDNILYEPNKKNVINACTTLSGKWIIGKNDFFSKVKKEQGDFK